MATFLDTPLGGAHPAVVSYLASGSPIRQSYVGSLASPPRYIPPNGAVQPSVGSQNYLELLRQMGLGQMGSGEMPHGSGVSPSLYPGAAPAAAPMAGSFDASGVSYELDPILQKTLAARDAALTTARGNLLAQYKDLLLGFGSKTLAEQTLNTLLKQPGYKNLAGAKKLKDYFKTISDDPDKSQSTMGRLARAIREATINTNEGLSSSQGGNLFFSGARAKTLRDLDYTHESQLADATQAVRAALAQAMQGEVGTESQWAQNVLGAEESAYSRALEVALAQAMRAAGVPAGGGGGGSGGGGGGGGGSASPSAPASTPAAVAAAIAAGAPWNVAQPLSALAPSDLRVRRLA